MKIPLETNLSSTSQKKMNRTMPRTPIPNHLKQTINPIDLSRPKGKIASKQAKTEPDNTKSRITTSRAHPKG